MTDLTDKIAALPEMPESITVSDAHRIEPLVIALASRNALLCEALRDLLGDMALDHSTQRYDVYQVGRETVADARAVLAACEVK